MATTWSAPSTGPGATPPAPDLLFDNVKDQTERELQKLKDKLWVIDTNTNHTAEWEKIKAVFQEKKDTIKKISAAELAELKEEIEDPNSDLAGNVEVSAEWDINYNNNPAPSPAAAPETPPTSTEMTTAINFFKEEGEFIDQNTEPPETLGTRIGKWLKNMISGFVISLKEMFGQDVSNEKAQLEWYKDALSKKRVEGMITGLSPYMGWALEKASITKKEWLADFIEWTGIPLVYRSENGQQQIMIAPQVMKYVFEWTGWEKLQNILKNKPETFENIQAVRGKYLSQNSSVEFADISAIERVKKIFTVEEEKKNDYIWVAIGSAIPDSSHEAPPVTENAPISPEVQTELRAQAVGLDEKLTKAQSMPEWTPEEKNTKTESVKSAQEAVTKFKEERKNTILGEYTDIQGRVKQAGIELKTLIDTNSPEESEIQKRRTFEENLRKLKAIEAAMKTKIEEVMTQNGDTWEIKNGVNAEKMVSIETAVLAIENNTASVENRELSEEEKEKQEKMVLDLEKEVNNTLYGWDSDWKKNYQIDNPQDIIALEKEIEDKKRYANNDNLKQKISWMERKIEIAKLKLEAVKAFLKHARWLAEDEWEIPEYETDSDDFIHLEDNGVIDINTIKVSDWSSMAFWDWADERWDLSPYDTKIAESLWWRQEFVNVIKANVEWLKNNEWLFMPKKWGTKFTIIN